MVVGESLSMLYVGNNNIFLNTLYGYINKI